MPLVNDDMMEQAARNLCVIRHINPDETMRIPRGPLADGTPSDVVDEVPMWKLVWPEILSAMQVQQAIHTGMQGLDAQGRPVKGPSLVNTFGQRLN